MVFYSVNYNFIIVMHESSIFSKKCYHLRLIIYDLINRTSSIYFVINLLWLFLTGKCLKVNLLLCLQGKTQSFDVMACHLFYPQSSFSVQYLFSTSVTISFQFIGCVCYIFARLLLGLNESTCQIKKNVFHFTSKPLFVLEKIVFQNSTFSNFMPSSNA